MNQKKSKFGLLALIGPGILVAATGVGAGDLATASLTGINLGVAILWAAVVGAFVKFVLNEGLARWQMATGDTLLEGCVRYMGRPFQVLFLIYLVFWSVFVGAALMAACGVTAHALLPVFDSAAMAKVWFGILHSVVGAVLVLVGGFKLFQKIMSVCIGIMFVTVLVTAVLLQPDWGAVLKGLCVPVIPKFSAGGLAWTVALFGGVGGTLTVLCYGYWIRETDRKGTEGIRQCRIDLAVGYSMTALFAVAMVIIGSQVAVEGKGAGLMVSLADKLGEELGGAGRWVFLVGSWGAVFSSLFGVWQCVPYVFSDFVSLWKNETDEEQRIRVSSGSLTYRSYLAFIALFPIPALLFGFQSIQKFYAVFGACFIPFLAVALLFLSGSAKRIGERHRNRLSTNIVLAVTVLLFLVSLYFVVRGKFG